MADPAQLDATDQQVADVAAAQGRLIQLLAKAVAQRLVSEVQNRQTTNEAKEIGND